MKGFKSYLLVFFAIIIAISMVSGCGTSEPEAVKATTAVSNKPSDKPNEKPTEKPAAQPTEQPTEQPTAQPTTSPLNDPPEGYVAEDKAPAADILDLAFEEDTAKDISSSQFEITPLNEPEVYTDKDINKTVAEFANANASMYAVYDFNSSVHEDLSDGFTFEVYVMLYDDMKYSSILGYTQSGGVSIDFDENKGAIGFGIRTAAGYVYVYDTERIDVDEYYHVVGVYDGETISLYYDGELIGSSAAGDIVFPNTANTYLGIGGDMSGTDQGEDQITGTIAIARVYSDALNASQVYNLYLDAVQA